MQLFFSLLLSVLVSHALLAQAPAQYTFNLDLAHPKEDKVLVTLLVPPLTADETVYNIPRMVPGTYSVDNYGRYISDFKAFDKNNKPLPVYKLDQNRWKITGAQNLHTISYWVDDTFEAAQDAPQVFEPTGTNIEENRNYLINTHGFMGYFDHLKQIPYEVTFQKPRNFYGSSALEPLKRTATTETYRLPSYMELVDSPLMFTQPDTTTLKVGSTNVLISVYSPNKKTTSAGIAPLINTLLEAQKNYLGGKLPVNKYAFLIYLAEKQNHSGSYGALEHSYSSVYYLPERESPVIANQLRSIAAHEFFHIVTPLNIHAEQIHDFDFNNPTMSKHLWLYEGTTEYAATHVQVNQKMIEPEDYLNTLRDYLLGAAQYNDTLPFTALSKGALDKYADQYGNVYQKGALIGLALDIRLRELSDGSYGLRHLMVDLAKKYGKDRSFADDALFDQITALTYPEIREFFRKHVEGNQTLPYTALFRAVGIQYTPYIKAKRQTLGGISIRIDRSTGKLFITDTSNMNLFGRKLGYKTGDELVKINDQVITPETAQEIIASEVLQGKEGTKILVLVNRKNNVGEVKEVVLKGKLKKTAEEKQHVLTFDEHSTPQQKKIREAWLFGNL